PAQFIDGLSLVFGGLLTHRPHPRYLHRGRGQSGHFGDPLVQAALAEEEVTNDLLRRPFLTFAAPRRGRGRTLGRVEAGLSVRHRLEAALPVGSYRVHERTEFVERAGSLASKVDRYLFDHVGLLCDISAPSC